MAEGEDQDKESKTEDASPKKLEEALEKGQVVNSKEVNNFFLLLFLTMFIIWIAPYTLSLSAKALRFSIEYAGNIRLDQGITGLVMQKVANQLLIYISPLFVIVVIVAIFSSYVQHGEFIFTFEQIQPKLSRISILSGLKRLFSVKGVVEFFKSLCKVLLVGTFLYLIISNDLSQLILYQNLSIGGILAQLQMMINHMMICVCIIMAVIASLDFLYQRYEYYKSLKMTKHEQKEEYKQTEGSPEVKRRLRFLRREQAQKRIKQIVPKATVIITNPEHYAVALQYEQHTMAAPLLIAKGVDYLAQKIKEIALEHKIPIIESPELTRSIYKSIALSQEIAAEHYEAVAKIITYVMSLKPKIKK